MSINKKITVLLKIFLAFLIVELFFYLCGRLNFIQDDSYISLQYAKNLISGNGLVFNEGQRVEGFTSFLWVAILTIPYLIKINPEIFIRTLGIGFGLLCLLMTFYISRFTIRKYQQEVKSYSYWFFLPVILLGVSSTFFYWAVSGMETTFYTFLCLAGIFFYLRRSEKIKYFYFSMLFLTFAFLTRQESVIFIIILFLNSILELTGINPTGLVRSVLSKKMITFLLIFLIPAILFLSFRYFYYGYLLPNTFYAKTGTSIDYFQTGIQYSLSFFQKYLIYGFLFILPSILALKKELRQLVVLLYAIVISYTVYVTIVGGDVLAMHRFFMPVLPLIYIVFTFFLFFIYQYTRQYIKKRILNTIFIFLSLSIIISTYLNNFDDAILMSRKERQFTYKMKNIASALRIEKNGDRKNLLIAASTVGALKYFSGCNILDMLGLTDRYIAHNPSRIKAISDYNTGWKERNYNVDYVMSNKPDYIIFSTENKPSSYAERALFTKEIFLKEYLVYPILVDSISTPFFVYKKYTPDLIASRDTIVQRNKNYAPSYVNIYNTFLNQINKGTHMNHFEEMKGLFDSLVHKSPSYFSEPYRFMALICNQKKDSLKTSIYLEKCLRIDPANLMARLFLYTVAKTKNLNTLMKEQENYIGKNFPEIYSKLNNVE